MRIGEHSSHLVTIYFFWIHLEREQIMDCNNDYLHSILFLHSPHDDFSDGGGRSTSLAIQIEFSSYSTESPRCQVLPQESKALYRGSRCSSALLILLCFNSDHGSTELLGQKVLCLHSDLGIFPKGTNYNGVFCDMGTHPLWIGLHPPTHFAQAMEHPSDGNDSHLCAMLRKSRSLPAE